jgi:magnesium transporter
MSSNTVDIDKAFIEEFVALVNEHNAEELASILERLYAQDIADIFDELELEQAVYVASLLEDQKKVDVLTELEPEVKLKFLAGYSNEEVANTFFALMDSDDAADILNSMDTAEGKDILRKIQDKEHSKNIASLLKFPENTAGALMAKEFIKIKLNWTVKQCTDEIRKQAEEVKNVFSAFVVDDYDELVGWVSLKRILLSNEKSTVADIYNDNVKYENTYASGEEVAATIQKYDLVTLPIVDAFNRLVGIITFDDVLDYVKDEAEKDYQMLSGISDRVESTDSVWRNTRARLPWLVVGLAGGVASSLVIKGFEVEIEKNVQLALFIPIDYGNGR